MDLFCLGLAGDLAPEFALMPLPQRQFWKALGAYRNAGELRLFKRFVAFCERKEVFGAEFSLWSWKLGITGVQISCSCAASGLACTNTYSGKPISLHHDAWLLGFMYSGREYRGCDKLKDNMMATLSHVHWAPDLLISAQNCSVENVEFNADIDGVPLAEFVARPYQMPAGFIPNPREIPYNGNDVFDLYYHQRAIEIYDILTNTPQPPAVVYAQVCYPFEPFN